MTDITLAHVTCTVSARVTGTPALHTADGTQIIPMKVVYEARVNDDGQDVMRVLVHGPAPFETQWRTLHFNAFGYDQYPPVPEWVGLLAERVMA